jgi:outer membrane protein assembly factor BamB
MVPRIENCRLKIENRRLLSEVAVATAMVGGAFSVIILALIAVNHFQRAVLLPKREQKLEALKLELRGRPNNEQLISQIRQLDLRIRQLRIRRQDFASSGAYLLLASVVTFLIAAKCAAAFRRKLPAPQPQPDRHDRQFHDAKWARQAVTGGLVMLGGAALFLALIPEIDLSANGGVPAGFASKEEIAKNWPRFRGPGGLGVSAYTNIPTNWNGKTSEGILWKTKVPLHGHNSPVVWDERVFLSGADPNNREVYCFDALSGRILWTGPVQSPTVPGAKPLELGEATGYAAPTLATDGRRVCAIFPTGDVACFDFAGKRLWATNLGTPDSAYGYTSSLEIYRNVLLIQYDQENVEEEKSKLIALDVSSGRTVWQTKRPVPGSWSSPIVVEVDGRPQVITCGNPWVIAYDPSDGTELWRAKCIAGDIVPSPIYAGGLVFAIEAYTKLVAIRPVRRAQGRGDITETGIAWSIEDNTPDICSPVSNGQLLYLLTTDGLLLCYEVSDGKKLWEKDLKTNFLASPSIVGDKLYLLSAEGVMFIGQIGPEYKELARCELGEPCHASPAFADGRIYIRSSTHLYCISNRRDR